MICFTIAIDKDSILVIVQKWIELSSLYKKYINSDLTHTEALVTFADCDDQSTLKLLVTFIVWQT